MACLNVEDLAQSTRAAPEAPESGAIAWTAPLTRRAYCDAMLAGRTTHVEAYLRAVLGSSLASALKEDLIRGDFLAAEDGTEVTGALALGLLRGQFEAAATYARCVAAAPEHHLWPAHRLNLLLARTVEPVGGRALGRPALQEAVHAAAIAAGKDVVPCLLGLQEAVHRYVGEIVASDLAEPEQWTLCAALHEGRTAVRVALDSGQAALAAGMVCAVIERSSSREHAMNLFKHMRVHPEAVAAALSPRGCRLRLVAGSADIEPWAVRLAVARQALGV